MIFTAVINTIVLAITLILSILPVVTIASIPVIGSTVSSYLTQIVQVYNAAVETLPHLGVAMSVFLLVILPFEALMLLAKFFVGHRITSHPTH